MFEQNAAIEFERVSKTYCRTGSELGLKNYLFRPFSASSPAKAVHQVLQDVSFTVRAGSCLGLIGRNGAGKSTILGLIAGVIKPSGGKVRVQGRIAPLLELGAGFHFQLTGRENILLNSILLGLTRREAMEIMEDVIAFAELADCIDEPLHTYSTGMQVRLGFAVAVHIRPEILLIDEVLAVGDEPFQKKCLDRIARFRAQAVTILLVTHNMNHVLEHCDCAIWLENGRVAASGQPEAVVEAYRRGQP